MTQTERDATVRQVSADGLWEWNGSQWLPTQPAPDPQQVAVSTPLVQAAPPAQPTPPAQTNPVSPDGTHQWNGMAWMPVSPAQPPHLPLAPPAPRKGHLLRNLGIVGGALLLVGIGAALAQGGSSPSNVASISPAASAPAAPAVQPTAAPTTKPTVAPTAKASPAAQAPPAPTLTKQQQNAARAAQSYLSFAAFSRQGLIDQLSSAYGDQYSVQDATIAVDSLNVDWNAEAVQSAKGYLKLSAFSCKGLIQQLDSPYGEKFTVAQATYGAQQAGAC